MHNPQITFEKMLWMACMSHIFVWAAEMLLEIEESSVGVMASGPSGMRHEVAAICAAGLAHNLHYESISFSWWFLS